MSGPTVAAQVGNDQLLALLDNTSAVIYMRNSEGRYLLINAEYERLFNVRREDVIGRTDHELFPGPVADQFRANDLQALRSGGPIQVEETASGKDGLRTYVTVKFPLHNSLGEAYAVCGISTDITDRKNAEDRVTILNAELEHRVAQRTAELEASTAELTAFAYSVSHDLRAPLRSLHGFSEFLVEEYAGRVLDETGVAHLRRLQASATRMGEIIDDLLSLSRTTRAQLCREDIDLGALATSIHQDLAGQQPERTVRLHCEPDLWTSADERLLRLAMTNLLTNAWKFTARRSEAQIWVGAIMRGTQRVFFVRDNGVGFDPRFAGKLFEPFQRLHASGDFEGNGIGLAIVQRVIRRHSGEIWAQSTPDQGTTFYFTTAVSIAPFESEDSPTDGD